jgi:predicted nuclease of restriction endonuclease-like RecB superfamily
MLTGELVRYKIEGDCIEPRFIPRRRASRYLTDCENIIRLIKNHTGKPQKVLMQSLTAYEGERTDYKILRGLSKLVLENVLFAPAHTMDYIDFRKHVFSRVQEHYPVLTRKDLIHSRTRQDVLDSLSPCFKLTPEEIMDRLYGDLPENQIITSFDKSYDKTSLLKRYNLALAQGLLYRSRQMKVQLRSDYRVVFQYLKLAGLMHWIHPAQFKGYEIIIDGPGSLLMQTQRYGIRMAAFLPGLILAGDWNMCAEIATRQGLKQFRLDHQCGLSSHYTNLPPFDSSIEQNFYGKFSRKKRAWSIEREGSLLDLGDTVFIPDFTFRHEDGRTAYMEIVGYWTPEYLNRKINKLKQFKKKNLILAVNSQLNCSRDDFDAEVLLYRTGIKVKDVLAALETTKNA